ncbi:hypothetical protein [Oricola nitratireducens]|uniref:hypothetical protein n=1 Tax=Oricola nitratireducens TaxID=2775868 RepID=UPI0018681ED4|nr:hypothetical protein [Oricola nitratireducens]
MSIRKTGLWAATAAAALMAMPPTAAFAFDEVDWNWDKDVKEKVNINIDIANQLVPTGIVEIEKLQAHFGDIKATSTIDGVTNNPPGVTSDGEPYTIEADVGGNIQWEDGGPPELNPVTGGSYSPDNSDVVVTPLDGGNADEANDEADFGFHVAVTVTPENLPGIQDARDLPSVENAATAVANNQSITSASGVYLHDGQFAAGDFNALDCGDPNSTDGGASAGCADAFLGGAELIAGVDGELDGTNVHTTLAALATLGAATGFLTPAEVKANATVYDILNATVDNSATAVTNNMAVEINAANAADATMIADITQWGYANVTATALLDSCHGGCDNPAVTIDNYANLRKIDGPIVSNTATAVGNNLSIKVNAPDT